MTLTNQFLLTGWLFVVVVVVVLRLEVMFCVLMKSALWLRGYS